MHEVIMKFRLELRCYCHVFKCSQSHKLSSNGARDTQLGKPDSMNFAIFIPIQRVRVTVYGILNPNLSVFRKSYDIVIYSQSEMQF